MFIIFLPRPAEVSRLILRRGLAGRLFDDKWDSQRESTL
jgi:hypothetical protein